MATATRHCDECEHWDETLAAYLLPPCGIGHKPRFYKPDKSDSNNWGWKRKCEDYKERHDDPR